MDSYDLTKRKYVRQIVRQAMSTGLWVTFSFKEKICTMHELLLQNVLPADILDPGQVFDGFSLRHIFDEKADRVKMIGSKMNDEPHVPSDAPKKVLSRKPSIKPNTIEK
jgi:hypothetical protein